MNFPRTPTGQRAPSSIDSARPSVASPQASAYVPRSGRHALIIDADARTATFTREVVERLHVHARVVRSMLEVGPHVISPPPSLLVVSLAAGEAQEQLEFASRLRASRGTCCIFVTGRLEAGLASALTEYGEGAVLCRPVHRDQFEATCLLALRQHEQAQSAGQGPAPRASERERHLEGVIRRVSDAVNAAGVGQGEPKYSGSALTGLRPREEEIVRLLLQHMRVPAIADRLGLTQQTIRNHLKGVYRRLGVTSQQELLDYFTRA